MLVPRDGDVARGGHIHDVGGVLLGLLEDVVGLGEVFDLVQHGGVGLVAHAGKAHLYRIPHFELGVLRGVQRDLQPGHREDPVQPVGTGDDPDLVQQLHRLSLHVQIVQVQGGKLQLQVVKLKVRQILPGLLQQHLGVAHIVPVHRLRDPAMARHCLVRLDVQASAVHALHRQIGVQRLDGTVVQPVPQRDDGRGILGGVPVPDKVQQVGPELDHLAACVRVVLQIVQIPNPVRLAHPEMAAIGFHQGVE